MAAFIPCKSPGSKHDQVQGHLSGTALHLDEGSVPLHKPDRWPCPYAVSHMLAANGRYVTLTTFLCGHATTRPHAPFKTLTLVWVH